MFKVEERLAVLSDNGKGVTVELTRGAQEGKPAALDVRRYVYGLPRRGVSLTDGAAVLLMVALMKIFSKPTEEEDDNGAPEDGDNSGTAAQI